MEQNYKKELKDIIPAEIVGALDFFFENELVTVQSVRNYLIKHDYKELKKTKLSDRAIRYELSDKYSLSAEMVYNIVSYI